MIEEVLFTRLSTFNALTALIGTAPVRVYPVIMPQGATHPAVTYQLISGIRESAMVADPGLVTSRYQFTAWATTNLVARNVIKQVRLALERYSSGIMANAFIETEYDVFDEEAILHGRGLDVIVNHTEDLT
jgi:hypothetical protein